MRALIVDDDSGTAKLLARLLPRWGWTADECGTVAAAMALFQNGEYDLAICDVDLPDGDGVLLAMTLSAAKPSLAVIIASGDPANLERARSRGMLRRLPKPFEIEALMRLVETVRA